MTGQQLLEIEAAKYMGNVWYESLPQREQEIILFYDATHPRVEGAPEETLDV